MMRVRVQQDAILLRWAPNTPIAWKRTNRSGFRVERYTIVRDGKILSPAEKRVLGEPVLRALPLEAWIPVVEKEDNAGIIAQALYGSSFEVAGEDAQGIGRMINMAQELEQRFTFSLYAADQNFEVACMAAWGYRDTEVKEGERYLYRVIPATVEDSTMIRFATAFTGLDEYVPLPRPLGLVGVWNDKSVLLAWDYSVLSGLYNSYYIEKSEDGKHFRRLEGRPVSSVDERQAESAQRLFYMDTLADNDRTYHYRIRGVTAFGEVGPVSDTVSGKGMKILPYAPAIRHSVINRQGKLELEWEFDERGEDLIRGFELTVAERVDGKYRPVVLDIAPALRFLTIDVAGETNYYRIKAVAKEGKARESYPVLIQPLDTIPPLAPVGLKGNIEEEGTVRLHWQPNTEKDIGGYIVYRAFRREENALALFDVALQDTCYTDTVEIRNLNTMVYYYVVAVDKRYNRSPFSECIALRKPDMIPPVSPLISGYRVTDTGIEIRWVSSPDEDVEQHLLYRKEKRNTTDSVLIAAVSERSVDRFVDTALVAGQGYVYSVFARDYSGLLSTPTPPLTVYAPKSILKSRQIERLDAVVDKKNLLIKLIWSANLKGVKSYEIYRSEGEAPLAHWKTLPGWQTEVLDEEIAVSMKYRYMIRALFLKGGNSQVKEIIVDKL